MNRSNKEYGYSNAYTSHIPSYQYDLRNPYISNSNKGIVYNSLYRASPYEQKSKPIVPVYRSGMAPSPSSKIAGLNQRLEQETAQIRRRSALKYNSDIKSTFSQSHKSRLSYEGMRRLSPSHSHMNKYQNNHIPQHYHEKTHSLSNSRSSDKILNKPIITYTKNIQYPINSLPSFKKNIPIKFQQPPTPIIRSKQQNRQGSEIYNYQIKNKINNYPHQKQQEEFQEFLDMDFKNNNKGEFGKQTDHLAPVSPVTYCSPTPTFTYQNTNRIQQQQISSQLSPLGKQEMKNTFAQKITNLLKKIDNEGKRITICLVGLSILLVLLQIIK